MDSSTDTRETVDGKAATIHVDDEVLTWEGQEGLNVVSLKNIIAIIPTSTAGASSVLFTSWNEGQKGYAYDFKFVTATGLPASLMREFQPRPQAHWQASLNRQQDAPKLHILISTGSGTGLAQSAWTHVVEPLLFFFKFEAKDYSVHTTTSSTSITEFVSGTLLTAANEGVPQTVLLLSGDGGMVDTVNTLLAGERTKQYVKPTITLLPLGTGNALAHSSGLTEDDTLGLRAMLRGRAKEVPLFSATFSPGARLLVNEGTEERLLQGSDSDGNPIAHGTVVCSWGHHATLVADSDTAAYRKHGAERFKMAATEALFPSDGSAPHAYRGRVSILRPGSDAWKTLDRQEHGYVLATLCSHLEGNFNISPASKRLDGKLRLVHFGNLSGQEAMDVMAKAFQGGKHVKDERVGYEEIEGLRIEFDEEDERWRRVCVDGKIMRVEKDGWVEVRMGVESVVDLVCAN